MNKPNFENIPKEYKKDFELFWEADENELEIFCFDLEKLRKYQQWKLYGDKR
jgi:hypothetical protein